MPKAQAARVADLADLIVGGYAMHAHASDRKLKEKGSAKFFVKQDGSTVVARKGALKPKQITGIQDYIKINYLRMYVQWRTASINGFYVG